ncbi:MAG: hypothetical protein O2862_06730 [Bacteroidetes bacterium]|nr:hypothetical protein [Bacteroidota bacterium]
MGSPFKTIIILISLCCGFRVSAQLSSQSILNPIDRFAFNPGVDEMPKFYFELGQIELVAQSNFKLGQVLGGDAGSNLQTLARANDILFIGNSLHVRPLALARTAKGRSEVFGVELIQESQLNIDADFIQLVTEGISLTENYYLNQNKGINLEAMLKERLYYGVSKKTGSTRLGFRLNLDVPLAGVKFITDECLVERAFNSDTNFIRLAYSGRVQTFGEGLVQSLVDNPANLGALRPSKFFTSINVGIEKSLSSAFDVGVSVVNFPLTIALSPVNQTSFKGAYSFAGVDYDLGADSISDILNQVSSLNIASAIPTLSFQEDSWDLKGNYSFNVHARLKRSNKSEIFWYLQRNASPNYRRTYSGLYYYDWDSKFVQTSYGASYLLEYGVLNPSISIRALLMPWTRLTFTINNPLNIPRFQGGMPYFHSDWSGLNFSIGLSFGKYAES